MGWNTLTEGGEQMSELKAYKMVDEKYCTDCLCVIPSEVYLKSEADKVIAEKDKEIAELKKKLMPCLNGDCILTCEVVEKYGKENRRMKRALWLARAEWAKWQSLYYWYAISDKYKSRKFDDVERKCRAKAEEYK